jgi:hypothetical protein
VLPGGPAASHPRIGDPEPIELALRAFAVPSLKPSDYEPPPWTKRHPDTLLVFDTETTLDPAQRLTFGVARLYRPRDTRFGIDGPVRSRFECFEEYLFHGDSVSADDLAVIDDYVNGFQVVDYHGSYWDKKSRWYRQGVRSARVTEDGVPILVRSRADFVRYVFMRIANDSRCLVVGFNLPFDLARLAIDWADTRRPKERRNESGERRRRPKPWDAFEGGFSLVLGETQAGSENRFQPRVAVKTIDSKRHLTQFRGGGTEGDPATTDPEARIFRGHFLDLRTLAFALTNESHSLRSACETFGTEHGKDDHSPTGFVTANEITYGRHDVRATYELAEKLLAEYAHHPISPDHVPASAPHVVLQATKAYSPASIGKAYLSAMGIEPPHRRWPTFPVDVIGKAMTAFYGGRAECRIRRHPMPVRYVDFTSMYPTVNGLMRLWDYLTAAHLDVVDATDEVRTLLTETTLDAAFDPEFWRRLPALVEIEADGDILPTRGAYEGPGHGWQIGVNPLTSGRPLWFALPDVVAATLLRGTAPKVLRAVRFQPSEKSPYLQPVALRDEITVDPAAEDFFRVVIEQRNALPDRDGDDKPMSDFLKVLANATSYGIFAEMVRHELPKGERIDVTVTGLDEPYRWPVPAPEEPGAYAFPPLAALITSAARLMLALLERLVSDAGGSYVMVDTDSMAIVATEAGGLVTCPGGDRRLSTGAAAIHALSYAEVEAIRARFSDRLNPYRPGAVREILKLESVNDGGTLYAFAISAKRYALFNLDDAGEPIIRKKSEHGLGHLLNPDDLDDQRERSWITAVWANLVREAIGQPTVPLGFEDRPAVSRISASASGLLHPFDHYNGARQEPDARIRPFNFLLSANIAPLGYPPGTDPARFHLVSRFERDPSRWLRMRWVDRYDPRGRTYAVTTGPSSGSTVQLKSMGDVIAQYRVHPESKSLGPDGLPCGRDTTGLLARRPVRATSLVYIGKEANELDAVEEGLVHDLGEVLTDYGPVDDPWRTTVLPLIRTMPTKVLAELLAVDRKTVQRTKAGSTVPHAKDRARWQKAAQDWTERFAGA